MKILLVDDTELFLDIEKSYLDRESFALSTASNGHEALEAIARDKPDLILLDLFMPDMDGDVVCRSVKGNPDTRSIPVIMTSSESTAGVKQRCIAAGCDAFVAKPINREELLAAIEKLTIIAKRRFSRFPTRLACVIDKGDCSYNGWIHTISQGGLCLEVFPQPSVGDQFDVNFTLPHISDPIKIHAAVTWTGAVREGGPNGVGVIFTSIKESDRTLIRQYVESKLKDIESLKRFT